MTNTFTLDSLKQEVEEKFVPFKVGLSDGSEVVLRNLMRLSKTAREEVSDLLVKLTSLQESEATGMKEVNDMADTIDSILALVADRGPDLIKELDGDLGLASTILNKWMSATQAGEAENSPT